MQINMQRDIYVHLNIALYKQMKERSRMASAQLNNSANSAATQPVNEARSIKRNQQIKALHLQFEDLKRKIKDVENKNQKIIENIHKQYDFKKKPNLDNTIPVPVVHYDRRHTMVPGEHGSSAEKGDERPPFANKNSKIKKNLQQSSFYLTGQHRRTENPREEQDDSQLGSNTHIRPQVLQPNFYIFSPGSQYAIPSQDDIPVSQFAGLNNSPYQYSAQLSTYQPIAMSHAGQTNLQLEESLKRQREKVKFLERELQEKDEGLSAFKKMHKKCNNMVEGCTETVEVCLQEFFEDVLKKKMYEIEKYVKRAENRLRKLQLSLKDKQEDGRSRRLIQQHRTHRSHSRNRRQNSPKVPNPPRLATRHTTHEPHQFHDTTKSKLSEFSRPSQFEQIATQYQEIIKVKTKELEESQNKLRQKEAELNQMIAKCTKLELKVHDFAEIPKSKSRKNSQKDDNLLANLVFQCDTESQLMQLNKRITQLERTLENKQKEIHAKDTALDKSKLKIGEYESKIKKNDGEIIKLKDEIKKLGKQVNNQFNLNTTIKKLESDLQTKQQQFSQLRDFFSSIDSQKVKKECQNLSLTNKLKKLEGLLQVRENKIAQLQKIIQSSVGGESSDLLEHSLYMGPDQHDLHALQEEKDRLQEELQHQREQIFQLQKNCQSLNTKCDELEAEKDLLTKQVESLMIQNENMRLSLRTQQFEKYRTEVPLSPLKKLLEEGDCLSEDDDNHLRVEMEQLRTRCEELQGQLKSQSMKNFEENRKVLKLTSELSYFKEQLADRQSRFEELRKEQEEGRGQLLALQQAVQLRESELEVERRINSEKIREIQAQWLQFEQEVRQGQQNEEQLDASQTAHDSNQLKNSRLFLESSLLSYRQAINPISNVQHEKLQDRLKQAEKMIEVQKEMEERIINQYRGNVERLKTEIKQKNKIMQANKEETEVIKRKLRALELSDKRNNSKGQDAIEGPTQKVIELESELTQMREINSKRQSVQQQLYSQLGEKQQEMERLLQALNTRERRIQQLQDLLELKEVNLNSHITVVQPKKMRESMQSHCSLRYSMLSNNPNKDKTIQLDLSEVGQSFVDQNQSIISNVSEVFGRQEFPYQKMHLKRIQQRRLFQKTAAYIKSLKKAIEEKSRKIKLLQRKIQSLRNSELIRKDIYEVKVGVTDDLQPETEDIFKDYYSVQLENTHSQRYRLKQLEHETKLTIEQNNLLNNQIQSMQDELSKAEQQEDSLMKLKDLYKEQIKNLIRQNQDQFKLFEEQIKKQRQKLQQSDSLQRMEALKQIFLKVVNAFLAIETDTASKPRKKDDRKKQLEDYLKVCCNLMSIDPPAREKLLADVRQIKR